MKLIFLCLGVLISGCWPHWEEPSSKLASRANNYLDNDRLQFFSNFCETYGEMINCNKYEDDTYAFECVRDAKENLPSTETVKSFLTVEQGKEFMSAYHEFKRNTEGCGVSCIRDEYDILWEARIEIVSKEYPECLEIAKAL